MMANWSYEMQAEPLQQKETADFDFSDVSFLKKNV